MHVNFLDILLRRHTSEARSKDWPMAEVFRILRENERKRRQRKERRSGGQYHFGQSQLPKIFNSTKQTKKNMNISIFPNEYVHDGPLVLLTTDVSMINYRKNKTTIKIRFKKKIGNALCKKEKPDFKPFHSTD